MTSPSTSYWLRVDVTLKNLTTYATETVSFINRPYLSSSDLTQYWPILLDISDIGNVVANNLPANTTASFTIDNKIGSYGFQRKFSDKFDRQTIINQDVTVYLGTSEPAALIPSAWNQIFGGHVNDIRENITATENTLIISIQANKFEKKIQPVIIDNLNFPLAPQGSLGKTVPLVFGAAVQVPAIKAYDGDADTFLEPGWIYSVSLSDGVQPYYENQGINAIVAKGAREYIAIAQPTSSDPDNPVMVNATGATAANLTGLQTGTEYAFTVDYTYATNAYILTGGYFYFKGNGAAGTVSGEVTFGLYDMEKGSRPAEKAITTAVIDKADYSAEYQAAAEFQVSFSFENPVVLDNKRGYYISVSGTNETGVSSTLIPYKNVGANQRRFTRVGNLSTSGVTSWIKSNDVKRAYFGFWAVGFSDDSFSSTVSSPVNIPGYKYNIIIGTQSTYPLEWCSIDSLDLIIEVNGITDSTPTTITGTNAALIRRSHFIARFFDLYYTGSAWAFQGNFDIAAWNGTHSIAFGGSDPLSRYVGGSTSGRETVENILQKIMEQTGSRCALRNNGKFGVWAWGTHLASTFSIPEEDLQVTSMKFSDPTHCINSIRAYYNKKLTTVTLLKNSNQSGEFKDYANTLFWDRLNGGSLPILLATDSYNLFGQRDLANVSWDWLQDSQSAEALAQFYMTYYGFPLVEVDFVIPLDKYYTLEVLDIVDIQSPVLPSYFGTAPRALPVTYAGEALRPKKGFNLSRAKSYRAQIEAKTYKFLKTGAPVLQCTARLLTNPKDPT